jgi:hypothetical protein
MRLSSVLVMSCTGVGELSTKLFFFALICTSLSCCAAVVSACAHKTVGHAKHSTAIKQQQQTMHLYAFLFLTILL